MSLLQTGTPASQLEPQNFRNSSQTGNLQNTLNRSNVQNSTSDVLRAPATGKLQVIVPPNRSVLGVDTTTAQNQVITSAGFPTIGLVLMVVSIALAIYFTKRFRKLLRTDPEENDQD